MFETNLLKRPFLICRKASSSNDGEQQVGNLHPATRHTERPRTAERWRASQRSPSMAPRIMQDGHGPTLSLPPIGQVYHTCQRAGAGAAPRTQAWEPLGRPLMRPWCPCRARRGRGVISRYDSRAKLPTSSSNSHAPGEWRCRIARCSGKFPQILSTSLLSQARSSGIEKDLYHFARSL